MPPFPFPKFLFPKGTFPDGLRFDESSFTAPPKVKAFVDEHGEDALAALASELAAKAAKNRGAGGETLTRGGLSEEEELRAFIMDAMKDELDGLQFPEGEDMDEAMARLMESMQDFAGGINGLGRDYGDISDDEDGEFGYGSPSYGSPSYGSRVLEDGVRVASRATIPSVRTRTRLHWRCDVGWTQPRREI